MDKMKKVFEYMKESVLGSRIFWCLFSLDYNLSLSDDIDHVSGEAPVEASKANIPKSSHLYLYYYLYQIYSKAIIILSIINYIFYKKYIYVFIFINLFIFSLNFLF